jgi:hypothetical protein
LVNISETNQSDNAMKMTTTNTIATAMNNEVDAAVADDDSTVQCYH